MSFMTTNEAAKSLLGYYNHSAGVQPGGFATQLILCLEKADPSNQARLMTGFPEFRLPLVILQTAGSDALATAVKDGVFE